MRTTINPRLNVVEKLRELGNLTRLAGENHFKSAAYDKAADALELMSDSKFDSVHYFDCIDGIGDSIASKIRQIQNTGTCNEYDLLYSDHGDKLALMSVHGVGPKTAIKFWDQGMRTVEDIADAVHSGKVKTRSIMEGINNLHLDPMPHDEARMMADALIKSIHKKYGNRVDRIEACGSLRREVEEVEEVGDLDIVVEVIDGGTIEGVGDLLDSASVSGKKKVSGIFCDMRVDIRMVAKESYGAMVMYFTGSKHFNIALREKARRESLVLNEYGLWNSNEKESIAGESEVGIFVALDILFVEPCNREIGKFSI